MFINWKKKTEEEEWLMFSIALSKPFSTNSISIINVLYMMTAHIYNYLELIERENQMTSLMMYSMIDAAKCWMTYSDKKKGGKERRN